MTKSKLIGPGPHGRGGPRPQAHDKVIGHERNTGRRNILIGPGPKGRPHKRVDLEKIREAGREFMEEKMQKNRLKVLAILSLILEKKGE